MLPLREIEVDHRIFYRYMIKIENSTRSLARQLFQKLFKVFAIIIQHIIRFIILNTFSLTRYRFTSFPLACTWSDKSKNPFERVISLYFKKSSKLSGAKLPLSWRLSFWLISIDGSENCETDDESLCWIPDYELL